MMRSFPFGELLLLVTSFVIWSLAFVALYALHSLACEYGWPPALARGVLLGAWLGITALAGAFLLWTRRRRNGHEALRFLRDATAGLAVAGAVGTLWLGLPVVMSDLCGWSLAPAPHSHSIVPGGLEVTS